MGRLVLPMLLAFWVVGSMGIRCGPPATPLVVVPSATPAAQMTSVPLPTAASVRSRPADATATKKPSPSSAEPTATPSDTAVVTLQPPEPSPRLARAIAPTATAILVGTPRPVVQASSLAIPTPGIGEPLSLALDWRFDSAGHVADAKFIERDGHAMSVLASLDRSVYALRSTGQLAWRVRTGGPAYTLATLDEERLAVGDDSGQVMVLDLRGRVLWRHNLGSRVTVLQGWRPALGRAGDGPQGLLAGGWDERVTFFEVDTDGGRLAWQAPVGGPITSLTALPELVLVGTTHGEVVAFDPAGEESWRLATGAPVTRLAELSAVDATGLRSSASVAVVGLQDGRLLCLKAGMTSGWVIWQRVLGGGAPVWSVANLGGEGAPAIVAGTGGAAPVLARLSVEGELRWHVSVPSSVGAIALQDLDGDGNLEILAGLMSGEVQVYNAQGQWRGSVRAGLPVWGLKQAGDGAALVLADVVVWRVFAGEGPTGSLWLPPPAMVDSGPGLNRHGNGTPQPTGVDQEGGSRPTPTPGGSADGEATLVFLGDVALGRTMETQLIRYGAAYPWQGLGSLLGDADLAVANLESVLTTQGQPRAKSYLIRAHPQWGRSLVEAGLDLVTVANNHALDYGQVGLDETLVTLESLGIDAVGAVRAGQPTSETGQPALYTLNGVRVAVLGYLAARWNGSVDVPATDRLAWAELTRVGADVRAVRGRADLVVVLLHAGTEYAAKPSADQVAVAQAAVEAGADLVVGHHPHVAQTVERHGQGLIVYSLGDAVFDIPRPAAMRGDLLRILATPEGIAEAELWPFWIEDGIRPRLLDDGEGEPRFVAIYP